MTDYDALDRWVKEGDDMDMTVQEAATDDADTTTETDTDATTGPGDVAAAARALDYDCHACGSELSPDSVLIANGYRLRSGICLGCRTDGIGSAAFVTIDREATQYPDAIPKRQQKALARDQKRPAAQSVYSAATYLDRSVPAGDYTVRRVRPTLVQVQLPDHMDEPARERLAASYEAAGVWNVRAFDTHINLGDRQFGAADLNEPLATGGDR